MKHSRIVLPYISPLKRILWSRTLLFALLLILGLIISSEIRSIRKENLALESVRKDYDYYVDILQQETQREANLEKRVSDLTVALYSTYDRFLAESGQQQLSDEWAAARAQAGMTPVTGRGITITLEDRQVINPASSLTIIHDVDVQHVVDTLRALGADAISINGVRILDTSKLICNGPTIQINRKLCPVPYIVTAVGDTEAMRTRLENDSYLMDRKTEGGIRITVKSFENVTVPAFLDLQYIESQINLLEVVGYEK